MSGRWLTPDDDDWQGALGRLRHDAYHLPGYARHEAERIGTRPLAFLYDRGDHRFFLPLLLRPVPGSEQPDAASPYGYPGPLASAGAGEGFLAAAVDALVDALTKLDAVSLFVRLHPVFGIPPSALGRHGSVVPHGETIAIDLEADEETIWRRMRSSHRQEIRRARKAGFSCRMDPEWEGFDSFLEIYDATMARVASDPAYRFSRRYFEGLRRRLGGHLHLALVERDGVVVCGGLFTEVDRTVEYHLSGTHPDFIRHSPSKLMLDEVWRWTRRRGAAVLHLGGGVGAAADSLFAFKAGFSGWRLPFHTWRVVLRPEVYARLAAGSEATANGEVGYFPAYRRATG